MPNQFNLSLSLPQPSEAEQAHSQACFDYVKQVIDAAGGKIPFSQFMELSLYTPDLGYYASTKEKFGERGDFVTGPELTPLFGQCVARQCQEIIQNLRRQPGDTPVDILELGAGSGKLAEQVLTTLDELRFLPDHYYILEPSKALQQQQRAYLKKQCPHLATRVTWLNRLPKKAFTGMIIANEVLDALPVERFSIQKQQVQQYFVSADENEFIFQLEPAQKNLLTTLNSGYLCPPYETDDYHSEINLILADWLKGLSNSLAKGVMLFIDYGYANSEFYHPDRKDGTLACYYKHHQHSNPLILPGIQDISAHVNFTLLAKCAIDAGLSVDGFCNQASFLLSSGLPQLLANSQNAQTQQAVRKLTLPGEMGEACKVIALSKNYERTLLGFQLRDLRCKL
jgi:SAM-dependent MidA family methyltransferase